MRVLLLLLVAVAITAAYASSFVKDEEYVTVEERKQAMDEAIEEAKVAVKAKEFAKKNRVTTQNEKDGSYTSTQLLAKFFKRPSEKARKIGKANLLYRDIVNRAERKMFEVKRMKVAKTQGTEARAETLAEMLFHRPGTMLTSQEIARAWQEGDDLVTSLPPNCRVPTINLYRSINGTCNNLENPLYGSTGVALKRLVPPTYEDGISSLHGTFQAQDELLMTSFHGTLQSQEELLLVRPFLPPYPSARFISQTVVLNVTQDEIPFTHLIMQFGQFLDHDLDLSPEEEVECEGCEFTEICNPIRVGESDQSFGLGTMNNANCFPFRRSISVIEEEVPLTFNPLQQINDVTSYIDGSMIYGSQLDVSDSLRQFTGGLLLEGPPFPGSQPSLPIDNSSQVACMERMDCFLCGDVRCNEQVSLTIMHTLWLREHNRCARELTRINPLWEDEKLYQTCRKIVGALIQKITYEDYLPKILGISFDDFIGPYIAYDSEVDATIPNSFATAAYRYGHSLIRPFFDRLNSDYEPHAIGPLNLVDAFFRPDQFRRSLGSDPIVRGLVSVNARRMDEFMNSVLTTQLFQTPATPGLDLAALNLQRGRDHGLPPYLIFRNFCIDKFGISSYIENDLTLVRLLKLYGSLDTAELWIAGLSETRLDDGLLGATFACIFGLAFQGVRDGDRFFYKNPGVFTPKQVDSIERHSISRVICDNSDGIDSIQPDAFLSNQSRIPCSQIGRVDLSLFSDPECFVRVQMVPRSFRAPISVSSRSTESEFDLSTRTIRRSSVNVFVCVPVQCPTTSVSTDVLVFSSAALRLRTTITQNSLLPDTDFTFTGIYRSTWDISDFDNGAGLFIKSDCESSTDVGVVLNITSRTRQDIAAAATDDTDDTGLPEEIIKLLLSDNPNANNVEAANSDLIGKAEMMKQDEIKKTASLFSELEEALKKLN